MSNKYTTAANAQASATDNAVGADAPLTPEQEKQLRSMLKRQRKLLRRHEREERNTRKLMQWLRKRAAANFRRPPKLNPHQLRLLRKEAERQESS
jgi:hypothetical protein